jgi:sec-independent protein translocase protein TatA
MFEGVFRTCVEALGTFSPTPYDRQMLGNIGPLEIAVVLVIALLVFGPGRLPELGNSLGRGIREFRNTVTGVKEDEGLKALRDSEPVGPAEKPAAARASRD